MRRTSRYRLGRVHGQGVGSDRRSVRTGEKLEVNSEKVIFELLSTRNGLLRRDIGQTRKSTFSGCFSARVTLEVNLAAELDARSTLRPSASHEVSKSAHGLWHSPLVVLISLDVSPTVVDTKIIATEW